MNTMWPVSSATTLPQTVISEELNPTQLTLHLGDRPTSHV